MFRLLGRQSGIARDCSEQIPSGSIWRERADFSAGAVTRLDEFRPPSMARQQ